MNRLSVREEGTDLSKDFEARDSKGFLEAYCAVEGSLPSPIPPGGG